MKEVNVVLFILTLINLGLWIYFMNRRNTLDHSHSRWHFKEKERKKMKQIDNKIVLFSTLTLSLVVIDVILNMFID